MITSNFKLNTNENKDNILMFRSNRINSSNVTPINNNHSNNKIKHRSSKTHSTTYKGTVQPIKDKEDIERAKTYFHDSKSRYKGTNIRNYFLFVLGINVGRRIGDMLNLKITDLIDTNNKIKDSILLQEEKTNKYARIYLNESVKEAAIEYINTLNNYELEDDLFKTRQSKCMTRQRAWQIMNQMGKELNIDHMGTHTMRKTFGYQIIKEHPNDPYILATVSELYNHSSEKITRRYIGLDDEVKKDIYNKLNL